MLSAGCLATAADAAVREVREETGVETEFRSILAFRQHHHMPHTFGCSDLYFVCRLHPLTFDLKPCEKEVVRCAWMSVQELAASEESTVLTRRIARLLLDNRHDNFQRIDISMEEWPSLYKEHNYKLFLRTQH
ncbi:Nucleoside diphosphate-linked moiety X motif 6 [Geodia barretti]|uniref:Nucleoside diphosphate-linked moiety X motif 6 n=1 Tax=Geodia barretti TaxID=519541 RepID=A0AA35RZ44_GEOBA|nr:Nucleoside diphosphate-linked moiety X motif 6 [Geodia barretti]